MSLDHIMETTSKRGTSSSTATPTTRNEPRSLSSMTRSTDDGTNYTHIAEYYCGK